MENRWDELARIGWIGEEEVGSRKMAAFFELHIEQGPILEDENIDIGVVTHGQGLNWLQVTLTGKESTYWLYSNAKKNKCWSWYGKNYPTS